MKIALALLFSCALLRAQDISKLDATSQTSMLDQAGRTLYAKLLKDHEAKLAELSKAGVVIVRKDTMLSVDKMTSIAFGWPASNGQKGTDKSNLARAPYTIVLNPAKNPENKDVVQKWQINFASGSVSAIE